MHGRWLLFEPGQPRERRPPDAARHLRLDGRERRRVLHDPDRRLERVQRAPILLSQTVTPSQLTTGSIPGANVDRWWRVRANGPTGVAGAGSSTRRFRTTTGPVTTTTATAPPVTTTTLPPPPTTTTTVPADTVAVQIAEYDTAKRVLHVEATSTSSTATLTVTVTASSAVIGTLGNDGGGYRGDLAWSVNPQNITVRSSRGGVATRAVAAK